MVCWDADRLDLARVGIVPNPKYLCAAYARRPDVIQAAINRSAASALEADESPGGAYVLNENGFSIIDRAALYADTH